MLWECPFVKSFWFKIIYILHLQISSQTLICGGANNIINKLLSIVMYIIYKKIVVDLVNLVNHNVNTGFIFVCDTWDSISSWNLSSGKIIIFLGWALRCSSAKFATSMMSRKKNDELPHSHKI